MGIQIMVSTKIHSFKPTVKMYIVFTVKMEATSITDSQKETSKAVWDWQKEKVCSINNIIVKLNFPFNFGKECFDWCLYRGHNYGGGGGGADKAQSLGF